MNQADAQPVHHKVESGPQQVQHQEIRPARSPTANIKAGIYYADANVDIANRLAEELKRKGCKTELCDFHEAGESKIDKIDTFLSAHDLVLWIATNISLRDDGILKAARQISHYVSVTRKHLEIRFVTFQPREYLNEELPGSLAAYTTLREDESFHVRLDKTLKATMKRIKLRAGYGIQAGSTATTNGVTTNPGQSTPPVSDNITVPQVENLMQSRRRLSSDAITQPLMNINEPAPAPAASAGSVHADGVKALPAGHGRLAKKIENLTMAPAKYTSEEEHADESVDVPININVIHIYGESSTVQIGSDQHLVVVPRTAPNNSQDDEETEVLQTENSEECGKASKDRSLKE